MAYDYAKYGLTQTSNMIGGEEGQQRDESDFYPGVERALRSRGIDPKGAFGDFGANDVTPGWQVPGGDPKVMYLPVQGDLAQNYNWLPPEQLAQLQSQMVNGMLPVQTVTALAQSSPYKYGNQSGDGLGGLTDALSGWMDNGGLVNLASTLFLGGAATGFGAGAAGGNTLGLQQMGQAAGLTGSALSEFVASGGTLGSTAAGAGGAVAASIPQSYWSMLADSSGAGAPSAAAGTIGSNLSPATAAWMQSAGYTADQIASIGSQFGTNGVLNGLALDAGYNVADAFRPNSSFNPDVQPTPYERMYDSMSTQDLGQTVKPFTTNPSFADLGGTAGAAAGATGIAGLLQQLSSLSGLTTDQLTRLGGAGISSLASLYGASKLGQASMNAANRVATANQSATQLQSQMYQDQVARQQPFYQAGVNALGPYTTGIMGTPEDRAAGRAGSLVRPFSVNDFLANKDPGQKYRTDMGLEAIQSSAVSRGLGKSGKTYLDLMRAGQDYASQEYNNAYNRYNQDLATQRGALGNLAGFAPPAAAAMGAAGSNYGTNVNNLGINTATTYGNADMTGAAARQSAYMGAGGAFANALSPNPLNAYLNKQLGIA